MTEPSKNPERIRHMFGTIAPVYDIMNHALSLNIDRSWRRFTVAKALRAADRAILDVACGTGDLTAELRARAHPEALVAGSDFCLPMLSRARPKGDFPLMIADGLALPYADGAFDLVTVAFGLRNMADTAQGLREMRRVLRPGGRVAILEFTTPSQPLIRAAYLTYFRRILPAMGRLASKSDAYSYLRDSVLNWPEPPGLARLMHQVGFRSIRYRRLTFGVAVLHLGEAP